ncbi:MAG: hypothetical protein PVI79_00490 [Gammaproteobacteria bacterium]|jgi:hypothetical protein
MNTPFQVLPHHLLPPGTSIYQGDTAESASVSMRDPARSVFTDFHHTRPFSVGSAATLAEVNDKMIACGVRLLFVADVAGVLQGLVTYTDLFGEKPVRYIQEHGGNRNQIVVLDIMTPLSMLDSLQYSDVLRATVGDIVETIRTFGRQHLLVSQMLENGSQVIFGMFSSTHIEKRIGMKIELSARANTFADLERALT